MYLGVEPFVFKYIHIALVNKNLYKVAFDEKIKSTNTSLIPNHFSYIFTYSDMLDKRREGKKSTTHNAVLSFEVLMISKVNSAPIDQVRLVT